MDGSSESAWQEFDNSRGLNFSFSSRNPRIFGTRTVMLSEGNASHNSELVSVLKGRGITHSPELTRQKDDVRGDGVESIVRAEEYGEVSLRQWLDDIERIVDELECVHIFSQIVHIVKLAHSEGIAVRNVRPSCFVMSSFNRVSFIESASSSDAGSDSQEYESNSSMDEFKGDNSPPSPHVSHSDQHSGDERGSLDRWLERNRNTVSQINSEMSCLQSCSGQAAHAVETFEDEHMDNMDEKKHYFPMKQILRMESNWYTSPEEVSGATCSASDVYQLGVLLFELFCSFSSREEKISIMANLRHRVLPPHLLLKWPKEASLCLWLLHPEPRCRPKIDEILQSEFFNEPRSEIEEREAAIDLRNKLEEQEVLLQFLLQLQEKKQAVADSLKETISMISSDIEEVLRLQETHRMKYGQCSESSKDLTSETNYVEHCDIGGSFSRKRFRQGIDNTVTGVFSENKDGSKNLESLGNQVGILSSSRLMSNFKRLESAYFLTRRRAVKSTSKPYAQHYHTVDDGKGFGVADERISVGNKSSTEKYNDQRQGGWMSSYLEGLCKYHTFGKVNVKADLIQGDLLSSSNLVCSLSFDREGEFFATAGVNKKIKIFEYNSILSVDRDIHYPIVEMTSKSKLSSICWNGYIRNQIASSNFEGVVQVWDVTRSQAFTEMREHQKRVWSVDFSTADPMMLASGGDDGSVKLWNINQGASVSTIQTRANVCCVQFPTDSGRSVAFGSADHKIYYYDLRNSRQPLCTVVGHKKTVSYVKFMDSTMLVSASTDNTLKLWDLSMATSGRLDIPVQSYTGHLNVKNFVGLSVSDGFIATGSETNEVFVYHKAFPMPALSFKFTDSLSSNEVDNSSVFISSVCWRWNSATLTAANSVGNVKLLELA